MSASKPPPVCDADSAAPIEGGTPGDSPSATLAVALVTSEGELSKSFGYARSWSLELVSGALERAILAPSLAESVTSLQPIRSRNALSSKRSSDPAAAAS
jgi:hypothetical protein